MAIGVTRYVGTCQVCTHPEVHKITGMIESRNTRVDILSAFPELNHRALNMHISCGVCCSERHSRAKGKESSL